MSLGARDARYRGLPSRVAAVVGLGLLASSCGEPGGAITPNTDSFIAFQRDFRDYASWPRTDLGSITLAGHPPGPRWVHINHALPAGATEYPVGTVIVKVVQAEPDPSQWVLFAMVKRARDFNADGARGWEFFILQLAPDGTPVIVSRGIAPSFDGGLYGSSEGATCNTCHGTSDARTVDGILTPSLRPTHE